MNQSTIQERTQIAEVCMEAAQKFQPMQITRFYCISIFLVIQTSFKGQLSLPGLLNITQLRLLLTLPRIYRYKNVSLHLPDKPAVAFADIYIAPDHICLVYKTPA